MLDNSIHFNPNEDDQFAAAGPQIDPSTLPSIACPKCKSLFFKNYFKFKYSSGITNGTGEPGMYTIPAWVCASCGFELNLEPSKLELIYNEESEKEE